MPGDVAAPGWLSAYLRAREREGRLLPDGLVARLPELPRDHPLAREWQARADSAARLIAHVRGLDGPLSIIDAGCGNGWLAASLAAIPGTTVVGLDANDLELAQARRVFADRPNLAFRIADLASAAPPAEPVDLVVLASVIQYVADLPSLLDRLLGWLAEGGELHLLDSPLYRPEDVAAAQERSRAHYAAIGVPEMAEAYHHHTRDELAPFHPRVLHDPHPTAGRLLRRLTGRVETPFPWLVIARGVAA